MNQRQNLLIIDDEAELRRLLEIVFDAKGYRVVQAATAAEGIAALQHQPFAAVILDLGLPDLDGMEVLAHIRREGNLPVVILSVRSLEQDVIEALNAGADDYMIKPFRPGELHARLQNVVRRHQLLESPRQFVIGDLSIDLEAREVKKSNEFVRLTATEFLVLSIFLDNAGKVLTHKRILEQVRGPAYVNDVEYLRVFVHALRKKLERNPSDPQLILTESGIGYRFIIP
jgi:two-component system KDP operon response regulator KdpE